MTEQKTKPVEMARCFICGFKGEYGVEVVDTDWQTSGIPSIETICKDYKACRDRREK